MCRLIDLKLGRLGDGYGDLHYRLWLDAHLRPDGCDELRPWALSPAAHLSPACWSRLCWRGPESDSILLNLAVLAIAVLGSHARHRRHRFII